MSSTEWAQAALQSFDAVVNATEGFRGRPGQRLMAEQVALQEQLVNKDLPALAALMPQPFKFALAKGRGRYVCKLKLDRLAGTGEAEEEGEDDLFAEEEAAARAPWPAQT